jgi:hypothetical protein
MAKYHAKYRAKWDQGALVHRVCHRARVIVICSEHVSKTSLCLRKDMRCAKNSDHFRACCISVGRQKPLPSRTHSFDPPGIQISIELVDNDTEGSRKRSFRAKSNLW